MDFEWIAVALGDVAWIAMAFVLGLLSRSVGLPPLVGFLAAGFLLNATGFAGGEVLRKLSDLGITLLLFVVGLKLNLRTLGRPQVWAVAGLHMTVVVLIFGTIAYVVALLGASFLSGLDLYRSLLIAFALSFSSTVFAVRALEEKAESASLHGRVAVGILIFQDLAAVVFLAFSANEWPTLWALAVLLLIPLRPLLALILRRVGHGELLVLYGLLLALGGAELFDLIGLKGDLGALVLGVLIASHSKAPELAKSMLGFKDIFLLGFFLSIGLSAPLTIDAVLVGAAVASLVFLKSALFFALLTGFKLRARTSLFASFNLTSYSEFGLIVAAIGVANGWLDGRWLAVIAIALALTCIAAAGLNVVADRIYARYRSTLGRMQRSERVADDRALDIGGATIAVIGMGRVGSGAYDTTRRLRAASVVGVDVDPAKVGQQQAAGRNVILGDAGDADFWERVEATHTLELVMLALPNLAANLAVLDRLDSVSFHGHVAAVARYQDDIEPLERAGASTVFNVYAEAGSGFAAHVAEQTLLPLPANPADTR